MSISLSGEILASSWTRDVLYKPWRRKVMYGGRGAGKTFECSQAIPLLVAQGENSYFRRPLRCVLSRELQGTIDDSIFEEVKSAIERLELPGFDLRSKDIKHANGGRIFMRGLSRHTAESIKSLADIDIYWCDEAHSLEHRPIELLEPTIRKEGSEIWYTFNPHLRSDPIYRRYVAPENLPSGTVVKKLLLQDNAKPTDELIRQYLESRAFEPERFRHIWLGEPDDGEMERKLMQYADLRKCVVSYRPDGVAYAGLDIASSGKDKNALIIRIGPCIVHHERWGGLKINDTVRRAATRCTEFGVGHLFFDVTGLGAGADSTLYDMQPGFKFEGIHFSAAVANPKGYWGMQGSRAITQKDRYKRRTSQLGDAVRSRLQATLARTRGETRVPLDRCLFIDSKVREMETLLIDLSQPEERETPGGQMIVEKQPKKLGQGAPPSPDSYDATILAYTPDSYYGLEQMRWTG